MKFILASTSAYRRSLIEKIGIDFETQAPNFDEATAKLNLLEARMSPYELAEELSYQKGLSVFERQQNKNEVVVLSGDQLVQFNDQVLGKAETHERAVQQLKQLQSHPHQLITSLTLFHKKEVIRHTEVVQLRMRSLTDVEINNYLLRDQPYDCAGSYKIEKHGIALFESITCHDYSAIEGIPMIWLCNKLKEFNYEFFKN